MDQVTQILLGGTAAQALLGGRMGRRAAVVGGVAGFAPDLDVLLKPLADPIFPMEVHRTVTHSLVAIPVGALLVTALFLPWKGYRRCGAWLYLAALVGWLTHAPLDACTSYGTMLFWPFARTWVAWDLVAIVDPVFSLVLLVGLAMSVRRKRMAPARVALALAVAYLGLGYVQRERALAVQADLAAARGHVVTHARVIPRMGGLVFWRSLYREGGRVHADQLRLVPLRPPAYLEGASAEAFTPADLPPDLVGGAETRAVFRRFWVFADGFLVRVPSAPSVVGDVRYSLTAGFDPVWGVVIEPDARPVWVDLAHVREGDLRRLLGTLLGTSGRYQPVPPPRDRRHADAEGP